MINKASSFFIFILLLSSACSDKLDISKLKGRYKGTFTYVDMSSSVAPAPSGPVEVNFSSDSYQSTGNSNYIPAGGSGTFHILENKNIEFKNTNMWTANFDWNLILNGTYTYKLKGDSLILSKEAASGIKVLEYRLKRIE